MYFDAYLKNRNPSISNTQTQSSIPSTADPNNKFSHLRPPISQPNLMITKPPPFHEIRSDTKVNSSAHIYLSAAKATNLPPRVGSNMPQRQDIGASNIGSQLYSRHQLTDQQKYICHSPAKVNSRTSAGLVFEEIPQNRFDYRRSDSISDLKANESYRESAINYYQNNQRQTESATNNDNRSSTSPVQVKFNASNAFADNKGRITKREGYCYQTGNRQEKSEKDQYSYRKSYKDNHYEYKPSSAFDSSSIKYETYSSKMHTEGNKYDLEPRKYDFQTKKYEGYRTSEDSYRSNLYSMPVTTEPSLRKESSQDFLKKYSASNIPEIDKTLDHQIETLRFANKKADELVDRQMNKNTYLNQLFEQKGLKIHAEQKPADIRDSIKEKKEVAAKNFVFERELEEKNKEIFEKNKELYEKNKDISDKSKTIIEKNKQIETLTLQLKDLQERFNKMSASTVSTQSIQSELLDNLHRQLREKSANINSLQNTIKENERHYESKQQQKQRVIESLQSNILDLNKKVTNIEKEVRIQKQQKADLRLLVEQLTNKNEENQSKINVLLQENSKLKQQSQSQKLSLIHQYKKQTTQTKQRHEQQKQKLVSEKQLSDQANKENVLLLSAQIISLTQRNSVLQEQLQSSKNVHTQLLQRYVNIQQKYSQIASLLFLNDQFTHEQLLTRLKEYTETASKLQSTQSKQAQKLQDYQVQRMQQQHLQRRHQQLTRQLKKVGSRLACTSIEAQQGGRLLLHANNQIILMNLMNLNEKYKYLLAEQ